MPRVELPDVRRLLAVRLDNVGDVVMLGPALRALRLRYPGAWITAMLSPAGGTVAPLLPWVDEVMVYRAPWQDASNAMPFDPGGLAGLSEDLAARRFDAAFIFTSFSQSPWPPAYACYLAGIPIRVGESKEFGGSILSHVAPSLPDAAHQVDRNLHLLESVGIEAGNQRLELAVPAMARREGRRLLRALGGRPYVLVCPGASCAARRYDPLHFATAARLIARRRGLEVVVAGSAREEALCAAVATGVGPGSLNLAGRTELPVLAALIADAAVLLANDSGPMHIADAVGTPMVIAFSGTELESQWEPRSVPSVLLRRPTDCAPCHLFECRYEMECLDIAPDEMAGAADRLLAAGRAVAEGVA